MKFAVEASVLTDENLDRVPALVAWDERVIFQGGPCNAQCILVDAHQQFTAMIFGDRRAFTRR